ncbi:MAG: pyruvate dehydrogenase (acetyl-transferring) E1 component subunit alpha [Pseudomonadales bacterium]
MTTIAEFKIHYSQLLDEQAQCSNTLEQLNLTCADLLRFYRSMVFARTFDTKAIALQRTGRLGTYASCLGQEAISCAIGLCMQQEDVFIPGYRDAATLLQRGAKVEELLLYWGGDERGMNFSVNREDLPYNVPISSQCCHAVGVAYAFKLRKQARVAVVVCGDGGTSEGDFYEALNAAGTWQLPIVFVVINNQWAISVPRSTQSSCKTLAQKAIAGGFSGEQLDGNDIIGCQQRLQQAIDSARSGNGPHLIEAISYRLTDHTTADDASRYREEHEVESAWQREPIERLARYLLENRLCDEAELAHVKSQCGQDIEAAVERYLALPEQPVEAIFEHMYSEMPEGLKAQLNDAKARV